MTARPEADNLVGIYAAMAGQTKDAVLREFGGQQFSSFKKALAEVASRQARSALADETQRLMSDPAEIDRVLADGAQRARAIAATGDGQGQGYRRFDQGVSRSATVSTSSDPG